MFRKSDEVKGRQAHPVSLSEKLANTDGPALPSVRAETWCAEAGFTAFSFAVQLCHVAILLAYTIFCKL